MSVQDRMSRGADLHSETFTQGCVPSNFAATLGSGALSKVPSNGTRGLSCSDEVSRICSHQALDCDLPLGCDWEGFFSPVDDRLECKRLDWPEKTRDQQKVVDL